MCGAIIGGSHPLAEGCPEAWKSTSRLAQVSETAIDRAANEVNQAKGRLRLCIGQANRLANATMGTEAEAPPELTQSTNEIKSASCLNHELAGLNDLISDLEKALARFES